MSNVSRVPLRWAYFPYNWRISILTSSIIRKTISPEQYILNGADLYAQEADRVLHVRNQLKVERWFFRGLQSYRIAMGVREEIQRSNS